MCSGSQHHDRWRHLALVPPPVSGQTYKQAHTHIDTGTDPDTQTHTLSLTFSLCVATGSPVLLRARIRACLPLTRTATCLCTGTSTATRSCHQRQILQNTPSYPERRPIHLPNTRWHECGGFLAVNQHQRLMALAFISTFSTWNTLATEHILGSVRARQDHQCAR